MPHKPTPIPYPLSSFPGANTQESAGRLINCYAEPLGDGGKGGPSPQVWRRSAGLSLQAQTAQSGYRGGLLVDNLAYEAWENNASTIDSSGDVTSLGNFPGTRKISIARDQAGATPDVVAVDLDNGAYVLQAQPVVAATCQMTVGGSTFQAGDEIALTVTNSQVSGLPITLTYTIVNGDTADTIATALEGLINANATLGGANISATVNNAVVTISHKGVIGNSTTLQVAITPATPLTATIGGTEFVENDTISLTFTNTSEPSFPVTVSYTVAQDSSSGAVAAGLAAQINADATLIAANLTATVDNNVLTLSQLGSIGNSTVVSAKVVGSGNETVTFDPSDGDMTGTGDETVTFDPDTGQLSGGLGVEGVWNGSSPTSYNGQGNLPQPLNVCFQDGYFFFFIANCQCYASGLNILTQNALTFITANAKSDVTGMRAVTFSGVLLLFTSGHCEVWQDVGNPAPNFPYARLVVLEFGLVQTTAIAGWDTGFSQLLWVAQDFGVYWLQPGSLAPVKASPPDLDRLIEAQVILGNTLEAGCYSVGGKKFWVLSCPTWSWEFCINTQKWNERASYSSGVLSRWRGTCGHPAFNKFLVGDQASGNLLFVDDQNFTENGSVQLFRIESGPVRDFPQQLAIARADFDFDMGTGQVEGNYQMTVTGTASGTNGVVRLTVNNTAQANTGDEAIVTGVEGTTEANGTWPITVIDSEHIELVGSAYANAYTSGGVATDITVPAEAAAPNAAISFSKNGGYSWSTPRVRAIGAQGKIRRSRATVKHCGQAGAMGVRWRVDVTAPIYTGFLGARQSSDPREVGP